MKTKKTTHQQRAPHREHWHLLTGSDAAHRLGTALETGISSDEARKRLVRYGPNEIPLTGGKNLLRIFVGQLIHPMILLLLAAVGISIAIGHLLDAGVIGAIVLLNTAMGFYQEAKAERAMDSIRRMTLPLAHIFRDGRFIQVDSRSIVPGDIVRLEAGDRVPADLRLLEVAALQIDESALTGESVAVFKNIEALQEPNLPLGDRINMAFMGTHITGGRALGLCVETGRSSQLGHIAGLLKPHQIKDVPLKRRMERMTHQLVAIAFILCFVILGIGILQGQPLLDMVMASLSLGVAAIPEGLPAVITISLSLGALRLSHRGVLVRHLQAVEGLGSITVICTDKTGTLTENRMTVIHPASETAGKIPHFLDAMVLCNDAHLSEKDGKHSGDPMETALLQFVDRSGMNHRHIRRDWKRTAEIPFDADRKRMTTEQTKDGKSLVFMKGAPESVLSLCTLPADRLTELRALQENLSSQGLRVLALAQREGHLDGQENNMTFLGFVGLKDPLRGEAKEAIAECRAAGIRPVMITGDYPTTAIAIGRELGIYEEGDDVLTGRDLSQSDWHKNRSPSIFARVSPEDKLTIVRMWKDRGEIVAMTGDGVNDAPALSAADIGIAMGGGTDVAKEASSLILTRENFSTIVHAVREGRVIYDNIRKFVRYMLTTNWGEIVTMMAAVLAGLPIPLIPVQILWINLVTDGLPAVALGFEPAEGDVMRRGPRQTHESLFSGGLWQHILWVGAFMGIMTAGLFALALHAGADIRYAQTMAFVALTVAQMGHVMAIRSEHSSLWRIGFWSNPKLALAVGSTVFLTGLLVYVPFLSEMFRTSALGLRDILICMVPAFGVYAAVEIEKVFLRNRRASP